MSIHMLMCICPPICTHLSFYSTKFCGLVSLLNLKESFQSLHCFTHMSNYAAQQNKFLSSFCFKIQRQPWLKGLQWEADISSLLSKIDSVSLLARNTNEKQIRKERERKEIFILYCSS